MLRAHGPTLVAAAELADRQRHHLGTADGFVGEHLSHLDAFSGVLTIFRDDYTAALGHVHAGLADSQRDSERLRDALVGTEREYAAADGWARHSLGGLRDWLDDPVFVPGRTSHAPDAPAPSERGGTGLPDTLGGMLGPDDPDPDSQDPADPAPSVPHDDGAVTPRDSEPDESIDHDRTVRDRDGTLIESPGQTLIDEVQGVQDSLEELSAGVQDIDASLDDIQRYRDFEQTS